ncbi:MAG: type II toxin-antitoxin system prevent-host-death family antitoxin [Propionibacteriaceae bacterium]|nr:type II toxin-antitoxin system prevent-host-death family antitoxin [Propionibacteriaceae bacterium]
MSAETISVSVYEAKTQLSRLLVATQNGADVTITRDGQPTAKLVAIPARGPRQPGRWPGYEAPDGWDEFTEQDARDWYGE